VGRQRTRSRLKFGIYTDAGEAGCSYYSPDIGSTQPQTGSEGHYEQDFLQFAKWGFDYVKVDWCGGDAEKLDPAVQYFQVARAIRMAEEATGRELYYSICNWGNNSLWTWAPGIGGVTADIWRTSGDIVAPVVANSPNPNRRASFSGMLAVPSARPCMSCLSQEFPLLSKFHAFKRSEGTYFSSLCFLTHSLS
jgi:hypothetical protein